MLQNVNLADKSYEELIREAVEKIPLYSNEWTNFNVSDPGITVLQNLSAFTALQQSKINEVTKEIRLKLLEILGVSPREIKSAKTFLRETRNKAASLRAGEKFAVGDLRFETNEAVELTSWRIKAAYRRVNASASYKDATYFINPDNKSAKGFETGVYPFGNPAVDNSEIYFIFDEEPKVSAEGELNISFSVKEDEARNPFSMDERENIKFADLNWQIFSEDEWKDVEFSDETRGFLLSGIVRLKLGETSNFQEFTDAPEKGFALRCILKKGRYDFPPKLQSVSVNLFEVEQKDTKAKSFVFHGPKNVKLDCAMADFGFFSVYAREKKKGAYKLYSRYNPNSSKARENEETAQEIGRYYTLTKSENGALRFEFDEKRFGYAPGRGFASVRIICYDEETVHNYKIGRVEGYENQIIDLENLKGILADEFQLLVEFTDGENEKAYNFVKPNLDNPDYLCYEVLAEDGKIKILEPGFEDDCALYYCDCAVTKGAGGNVIAGNNFSVLRDNKKQTEFSFFEEETKPKFSFVNPSAGKGGVSAETEEELRLRFLSDMKKAYAAITPEDCENLALNACGCRVHKAKATLDKSRNIVKIAVKPYANEARPLLSPKLKKRLEAIFNQSRAVASKIEIVQPVYVPINAIIKARVKTSHSDAKIKITRAVESFLDGVNSDVPFGARISYRDLFAEIEALSFVEELIELRLYADARYSNFARADGSKTVSDIIIGSDALYYAGEITAEAINL